MDEEMGKKIKVLFSFPNEALDPESISNRAYNCLARSKIFDTDTLLERLGEIGKIRGFGSGSKQVVVDYLVEKQIQWIMHSCSVPREMAEEKFLYDICHANDPTF